MTLAARAEFMEMIDERHPAGEFYYLHFIGVHPAHQGKGFGSALLGDVLRQRCDAEGRPAYLEATSRDNVRLYERHGFVALQPFGPEGAPPLTPMWREPRG